MMSPRNLRRFGYMTFGKVVGVKKMWWVRIRETVEQLEQVFHPHRIHYEYCVDGIIYHADIIFPYDQIPPVLNQMVAVFYEPFDPKNSTLSFFSVSDRPY